MVLPKKKDPDAIWKNEEILIRKQFKEMTELDDHFLQIIAHPTVHEITQINAKAITPALHGTWPSPEKEVPFVKGFAFHEEPKNCQDESLTSLFGVTRAGLILYREELLTPPVDIEQKPFFIHWVLHILLRVVTFLGKLFIHAARVKTIKLKLSISDVLGRIPQEPFDNGPAITLERIALNTEINKENALQKPAEETVNIAEQLMQLLEIDVSRDVLMAEIASQQ